MKPGFRLRPPYLETPGSLPRHGGFQTDFFLKIHFLSLTFIKGFHVPALF